MSEPSPPIQLATRASSTGYSVVKKFANRARAERYKQYLKAVAELTHEPEPVNPFKQLRLAAKLTLMELTNDTGLSKQALIRTEQGIYPDPPERLVNYWTRKGESYPDLLNGYEDFQMRVRSRHDRIFLWPRQWDQRKHPLDQLMELWKNPLTGLPFESAAENPMNPTELSKLLCISQAILNHWLTKPAQQKSVPHPVWVALFASGYSKAELRELSEAYYHFRCYKLGKVPEKGNLVNLDDYRRDSA